jgi:rubrerythrin
MQQRQTGRGGTATADSPVDDPTYNLLQALTSKLEAIEAYDMYSQQDDSGLFTELASDERRHAERLMSALKDRLGR